VARSDFELYLGLLDEFRRHFPCSIHAYVLMPNHVHILVTPREPANLTMMMKNVSQRYVQHFNRAYLRTGSLWEGRFRSCPIDSDGYLLRCQRYIELNPVRARLATNPAEYPWTSFRTNAGTEPSVLIEPHPTYLQIAGDNTERTHWYREFVATAPSERELTTIRKAFSKRTPLGTDPGVCPRSRRGRRPSKAAPPRTASAGSRLGAWRWA
jgi:putative transposase